MINFVLIMIILVVMLIPASADNECGGDDNGLGGVRCQIGRFLLDRQPCNHYLHHDKYDHHHDHDQVTMVLVVLAAKCAGFTLAYLGLKPGLEAHPASPTLAGYLLHCSYLLNPALQRCIEPPASPTYLGSTYTQL